MCWGVSVFKTLLSTLLAKHYLRSFLSTPWEIFHSHLTDEKTEAQ